MVRQTIAEIWVEIARSLASDAGTSMRAPIYEATCAVVRARSYRMLTALLRVTVHSVLGSRAHALCMRLYSGLKRMMRHRAL